MEQFDGGTLADEFLNDFEDVKDEGEGGGDEEQQQQEQGGTKREREEEEVELDNEDNWDVQRVSDLLRSERVAALMSDIADFLEGEEQRRLMSDSVDRDMLLISRATDVASLAAEHTAAVARFVKKLYAERFPELESLVLDTLEYLKTVQALKNEEDITKVDLDAVLPGHTCMIVRIGFSTTTGKVISEKKLAAVLRACEEAFNLERLRSDMLQFLAGRMNRVAPNLTELVGADVAAKLVSSAGGLEKLGKMHSNNIRVLGVHHKDSMGLSTATQIKHVGFLEQCELIRTCPADARTEAIRCLAGKATLAARVDAMGKHNGRVSVGHEYREEVLTKIAKAVEPPPPRQIKALPVPKTGEGKQVKRGGEQARRRKAKMKMTELRKQQNRLAFGEIKDETLTDIMGADLGLIGSNLGTGKTKMTVEDTGILKGLSKKRKMEIAKAMEQGQGNRTIGKASHLALHGAKSSLALEGDRGIELVERDIKPINLQGSSTGGGAKYFGGGAAGASQGSSDFQFAVPLPKKK